MSTRVRRPCAAHQDYVSFGDFAALNVTKTDQQGWEEAKKRELDSHKKRGTSVVVDRPKGIRTVVACKWVLTTKTDDDGATRYKARLCARGFLTATRIRLPG